MDTTLLEDRITRLERKITILTQLTEISLVLNSTLDLDTLLSHLMEAAAEITGSEAASVLLWDERKRELRFAATTARSDGSSLIGQPVPLEGSIAGTIMREVRPVQVNDVEADPQHYTKVDEENQFRTRSLLGVPMTSRTQITGVLEVVNKRELPWTQEDQDYLTVLAAQAAVAIESAQMVAALQKANRELNELDELKNQFIAIASHELRTPLSIILGYSSFLQETAEGKASEHAAKVLSGGMKLRRIIEDLTNLRYLQQNPDELMRESVMLSDIYNDIREDVQTMMATNDHTVEFVLPPEGDIAMSVDRIRVLMALTNILNNAAAFTPPGGQISIQGEQRGNEEIWIHIIDNGIGIAADKLDRVFDKFYQIEDHMTRRHGGLGIGLSITRALVEAHGGRIWATSAGLGKGSTFTIALPLAGAA